MDDFGFPDLSWAAIGMALIPPTHLRRCGIDVRSDHAPAFVDAS
jgi:hypothetical protein